MIQDDEKNSSAEINGKNIILAENYSVLPTDKFAIFEARLKKLEDKGRKRGRRYSKIGLIYSLIICAAVLISGFIIIRQINNFSDMAGESANIISDMNNKQIANRLIFHSAWKNCQNDSDCLETQADCCACASGGEQISINSSFLAEWNNLLKKNCENKACPAMYSCQAGKSVCQNKKCLFEATEINTPAEDIMAGTTTGQNIIDTTDADNDGLTEAEEIKYGTDVNNPDTDGDGFFDGDEIERGYNPKGEGLLLEN